MEEASPILTEFDVLVCVIVLIFMIAFFTSGFLKGLLSIFWWLGAALLTLYFFPYAATLLEGTFKSKMVSNTVAVISVFLISILIITVINNMMLSGMQGWRKGPIDHSLGMLFGLLLGMSIVSIIHYAITVVSGEEPEWLKQGQTYNLTRRGADIVQDLAPEYVKKGKEFLDRESGNADLIDEAEDKKDDIIKKGKETIENGKDAIEDGKDAIEDKIDDIKD